MNKTLIILIIATVLPLLNSAGCGKSDIISVKELQPGERAPDFNLKNQDQVTVKLSDFRGKRNVILVFYPLDFTPV